jgi:hypothetical protein
MRRDILGRVAAATWTVFFALIHECRVARERATGGRTVSTRHQTTQYRNFWTSCSVKHRCCAGMAENDLQSIQTDLNPVPQTIFVA